MRDVTFNSTGSFRPQSGSSAQAFADISLRGLGSQRTLVLVDGRRAPKAPYVGSAADLNSIPLAAVERIEILTGGAKVTTKSIDVGKMSARMEKAAQSHAGKEPTAEQKAQTMQAVQAAQPDFAYRPAINALVEDYLYKHAAKTFPVTDGDRIRELVPEAEDLPVDVYPLPNLGAVNVVIRGLLGQGVAASTRFDPQAKALGEWLRSRHVSITEDLL